jgi:hypothetical protein
VKRGSGVGSGSTSTRKVKCGSTTKVFLLFALIKKNLIFLIYKEIQNGAVAKSYMTDGLLIYG